MRIEVSAEKRELQGKGASRRLRKSGRVPAVVYGGEQTAESIEMDHNDIFYKLKMEAFHASILSLKIAGKTEQVLLRDVQWHPFKQQVLHIDFQRIDKNKKIHMKVPLHFINAEISPGVKVSSGIVSHILTEVDISCLPKDLPEFISVDLAEMTAGHSLHLSDLILPKDVEVVALTKGDNSPVVTIVIPRAVLAEDEEAAAAAVATPEAGADKGAEKKS